MNLSHLRHALRLQLRQLGVLGHDRGIALSYCLFVFFADACGDQNISGTLHSRGLKLNLALAGVSLGAGQHPAVLAPRSWRVKNETSHPVSRGIHGANYLIQNIHHIIRVIPNCLFVREGARFGE